MASQVSVTPLVEESKGKRPLQDDEAGPSTQNGEVRPFKIARHEPEPAPQNPQSGLGGQSAGPDKGHRNGDGPQGLFQVYHPSALVTDGQSMFGSAPGAAGGDSKVDPQAADTRRPPITSSKLVAPAAPSTNLTLQPPADKGLEGSLPVPPVAGNPSLKLASEGVRADLKEEHSAKPKPVQDVRGEEGSTNESQKPPTLLHTKEKSRLGDKPKLQGQGQDLVRKSSQKIEERPSVEAVRDRKETTADKVSNEVEAGYEEEGPDKEALALGGVPSGERTKRSLRPRQLAGAGRDGRLKLKREGSGVPGLPLLHYKEGEGMPDLAKFLSSEPTEGAGATELNLVEVSVAPASLHSGNRQVRSRQLWGTGIYTEDSDIVAALTHMGYYIPAPVPPPPSVAEVRVTLRVLPPQEGYHSSARNGIRSRAWGATRDGCSYSVEKCRIIKAEGGHVELEPSPVRTPAVAPTLAPQANERTLITRSTAQIAYRQQRFAQEVTMQYNLSNEPWLKYSMSIVADRGLKPSQYTSARLKKGEVLYMESHSARYQLSYLDSGTACNGPVHKASERTLERASSSGHSSPHSNTHHPLNHVSGPSILGRSDRIERTESGGAAAVAGPTSTAAAEKASSVQEPRFQWARLKHPLPLMVMKAKGIPLPEDTLQVVENNLSWAEIHWGPSNVWIRGTSFKLARAQWMAKVSPQQS